MGKKRVVQKGTKLEEARQKKPTSSLRKKVPKIAKGRIYIKTSYNNTLVTITDESGNVVAFSSAGALGFRGPKKSTPYAATRVVASLTDQIKKMGLKKVEVFVKGVGSGRESALRALPGQGLELLSIKDITPVPHNGPRKKKPRRV